MVDPFRFRGFIISFFASAVVDLVLYCRIIISNLFITVVNNTSNNVLTLISFGIFSIVFMSFFVLGV